MSKKFLNYITHPSNHQTSRSAIALMKMTYLFKKTIRREKSKFEGIIGRNENGELKVWRAKIGCKARNCTMSNARPKSSLGL